MLNNDQETLSNSKNLAKDSVSFSMTDPAMKEFLKPIHNNRTVVNDEKIRRLYLQASSQQWFAPQRLDFGMPIEMDEESRKVWVRFVTIFYTLEKMGLNVIGNMMSKAVRKLKSEEIAYYLSAQCYDESRHVFTIENYLKKLGAPPKYDWTYHVLGQAASVGLFRVENWLFSTLFSENFASVFLRRAKAAKIDPLGADMCKNLLVDESRHLHFLYIVLPDVLDRLSALGRSYVKMSQFFIMKFTEKMSRSLDNDGSLVGLDRQALLEEVFANVERAYDNFGVKPFLYFPKVTPLAYSH
jgi:hypothetical protein